MPEDLTINLQFVKPRTSETICRWLADPESLLAALTQHLVIPADRVNKKQYFVYSPTQPGTDDQDKVWIKTSSPYGIGFFAGGSWQVSYSIPSGLIYIVANTSDVPLGFRALTDGEVTAIGLDELTGGKYVVSR